MEHWYLNLKIPINMFRDNARNISYALKNCNSNDTLFLRIPHKQLAIEDS